MATQIHGTNQIKPGTLSVSGGVPIGGIILWSGTVASIPASWQLCDGTNGTPDLRDKFVVGAKQDDAGVAKTNLTGSLTQSGGAVSHHHADHSITQPAVAAHNITQPVVENHVITQPAISNHLITQPVVAAHTVTTRAARTSTASTTAAISALSAHSLSTNVALSAHSLSTNVAVSAHSLTTNVAVDAHALSQNVGISAHDTLSAPQPYFALCYIQRMS